MEQLLTTKLYIPPTRPELVSRTRLTERLNEGVQSGHKLTLISAPAGFGKTTLVSEWVEQLRLASTNGNDIDHRVTWLSIDEDDNDPKRFLTYFIAALRQVNGMDPTFGKAALSMLQAPQSPLTEAVLTSIINEIAVLSYNIVLILDDYHIINSPPVDKALTFTLEHLPPEVQLVIITRMDPHLPLARLRARGHLTELRAKDLRFTTPEAVEYLNQVMGLNLSEEDIRALESRTEGWIAGLHLAAISMGGITDTAPIIQSFTGSHRFVLDYLLEEVLEQQSDRVQTFLLQTAILDRFNSSLCDAVRFGTTTMNQDNGQEILEMLDHHNLFIVPLDRERQWYRYHHLFADLLRQRLHQTQYDQIPILHLRASEWLEVNGFADEAIEHAIRAEDFGRAARLIQSVAESFWVRGADTKLRRWLKRLPEELVLSKPALCIYDAWNLIANGRLEAAEQVLDAADLAIERDPGDTTDNTSQGPKPHPGRDYLSLRGKLATTRTFAAFYRGDVPGIIQNAQLALEYLPEQDLSWRSTAINILADGYTFKGEMVEAHAARLESLEASKATGNSYQIMIVNMKLASNLRYRGQLQQVVEICEQQERFANESGMAQTDVGGWLQATWGEVLTEMNDLEVGLAKTRRGVEIGERDGDLAMLGWSYLCLVRTLITMGDLTGAEKVLHTMENTARKSFIPPWIMNLQAAWQARLWLAQDKKEAAYQWAEERGLEADTEPPYAREMEYIVFARILIAQKRWDEAINLLQRMLEPAEAGMRISRMIEILTLQALSLQAMGDTARAMTQLERALALAEPGGFTRIFVDEGPQMASLLYEALSRGVAQDYVRQLLGAFPHTEVENTQPIKTQAPHLALIEPLSEREIEILQLIAEGLTNSEIAARLYLSLNTIKVHSRNIYGKLDVHNRAQAIARAQTLGLLT